MQCGISERNAGTISVTVQQAVLNGETIPLEISDYDVIELKNVQKKKSTKEKTYKNKTAERLYFFCLAAEKAQSLCGFSVYDSVRVDVLIILVQFRQVCAFIAQTA